MAETDPRTTKLTQVAMMDAVIGNRDESSVQQSMSDLATQLAASGAFVLPSALAALQADVAALSAEANENMFRATTTAEGLAETVEDQQFRLISTDPAVSSYIYRHDVIETVPTATLIETVPSAAVLIDKADAGDVAEIAVTASLLMTAFNTSLVSIGEREATAGLGLSDDAGWAALLKPGVDVPDGATLSQLRLPLVQVAAEATKIRLRLFARDVANSESAVPGAAGDVLRVEQTLPLADLGISAGAAAAQLAWDLPLPILIDSDWLIWSWEAYDDTDTLRISSMGYRTTTTETAGQRGWYRTTTGSAWGAINSAVTLGWAVFATAAHLPEAALADDLKAKLAQIELKAGAADLAATGSRVTSIEAAFSSEVVPLMTRPALGGFGLSNDTSWSAIIKPAELPAEVVDTPIEALVIPNLIVASGTTQIRLRLWTRAATQSESVPGGQSYDTLIMDETWAPADLGVTPDVVAPEVVFPLASPYLMTDRWLIWQWDSMNAADAATVGSTGYLAAGAYSTGQRGFYRTDYLGSATLFPINATWALACGLRGSRKVLSPDALPSSSADITPITRDEIVGAEISADGLSVAVSVTLRRQGDDNTIMDTEVVTAPDSGSVGGEERTLTYAQGGVSFAYAPAAGKLDHANVAPVVVTRVSDSAILMAGTDYLLNPGWGAIVQPGAGPDVSVTVSYDWSDARYDLLYLDAVTQTTGVVQGVEGMRGGVVDGAPEAGAPSRLPLAYLRVTADAVSVHPVWEVDGIVHRDLAAQWQRDITRNRRVLRSTLGALRSGATIVIAPYGDSIVAMQNGSVSSTTPNGTTRDRASSSGGYVTGEASLPLYDFGDGAGQAHTKFGLHWDIARAMEDGYGVTVEMQNWGVGGTRSSIAEPGGRWETRLAAYLASLDAAVAAGKHPVALIHFGMNEIGVSTTEADVTEILRRVYLTGADALVAGVARRNIVDVGYTDAQWRLTNRGLRRAAEYVDPTTGKAAGFIETLGIFDDAYNVLGLSRIDNCSANGTNHPGLRELGAIGTAATMWLD